MKNNNNGKTLLIYLLVSVAIICGLVYMLTSMSTKSSDKKYSEIMEQFDSLNVSQFELDLGSGQLKYKLKGEDKVYSYTVPNVSLFANEVLGGEDAENYRKKYNTENPDDPLQYNLIPISDNSFWLNLIPTLLMLGVMIFFFVFMMKNAGGGKMSSFGKTNAKMAPSSKKATFDDVAGADEEKEELKEIVDFLRDNKKYTEIGARIPKGVLLLGPPGTGKTLLARAVAGEAKVPFFSISGSDFVEMFVGVGASRVRDLFEQAKKNAPAIIFIDEIDAVGRQRGAGLGGGHDEREQTLNQLLVEMDGFEDEDNDSVIVMAATNRRDILDPALLRPGRFDRQILVGYPDVKGREAILKVHTRNKPLAPDVDLETIAKSTVGFTGADLENLVNEASLLAARKNKKAITKDELEEASIKVVAGPEKKSKVITEDEKKLTAYHEGGHALCTYYSKSQDKVHQVSIIPRGQAGGFTMSLPVKDKSYVSKNEMYENIVVLLGGRVAEKLILDDISTGASNDLERATSTARNMVTRYGFSDNLGPVVYGQGDHEVFLGRDYTNTPSYSDNVAAEIDNEIRTLIESAFTDAEKILNEHMDKLHVVAKYLMKYEKVDGATFEKLMNGELTESEFMGEPDKTPEIQDTPEIVDDISVDDN